MVSRPDFGSRDDEPRIVAVSANDLRELSRLVDRLVPEDKTADPGGRPVQPVMVQPSGIALAQQMIKDRRRRVQLFGSAMFGEPAWDALLQLYVAKDGPSLTIKGLAALSEAAPTTLLRWLDHLEESDLIRRAPHPRDARAILVDLTEKGLKLLDSYFS